MEMWQMENEVEKLKQYVNKMDNKLVDRIMLIEAAIIILMEKVRKLTGEDQ